MNWLLRDADGEQLLRLFRWLSLLLAACVIAFSHHWFNPDYMSYLDVGEAWLRGDFAHAVNGYWNPVFPILAAGFARLFPGGPWDPISGHILNFLLFIPQQLIFHWFLRQSNEFIAGQNAPLQRNLVLFGYPLFLWCNLILTSPKAMHADGIVGMALMAAAGMALRIANRGATTRRYAAIGFFLGFGYLTKVIMLTISALFLSCALFLARPFRRALGLTLLAGSIFVAINAPHVLYLSKIKGRLDLGDTGKLAYAWLVNNVSPLFHWTGEEQGFGTPAHAPAKILKDPEVFDYSSYAHGTYPPGYDPSYWNEGLKSRPNLNDQVRALIGNVKILAGIVLKPAPILLLIALGLSLRGFKLAEWRGPHALILPCAAGVGLYLIVLMDTRYIGYFLLIALLGVFILALKSKSTFAPRGFPVICILAALVCSATLSREALAARFGNNQRLYRDYAKVAETLKAHGVKPGDRIGVLGLACQATYARLARVQIIAEGCTYHSSDGWLSDAEKRNRAIQAMQPLNLRAIVLEATPENLEQGWIRIPGINYAILFPQNGITIKP